MVKIWLNTKNTLRKIVSVVWKTYVSGLSFWLLFVLYGINIFFYHIPVTVFNKLFKKSIVGPDISKETIKNRYTRVHAFLYSRPMTIIAFSIIFCNLAANIITALSFSHSDNLIIQQRNGYFQSFVFNQALVVLLLILMELISHKEKLKITLYQTELDRLSHMVKTLISSETREDAVMQLVSEGHLQVQKDPDALARNLKNRQGRQPIIN